LEEQRKIALDEHLNFIVDQTEKMTTMVAESLMKSTNNSSITPSQNSSMVISEGRIKLLFLMDNIKTKFHLKC